MNDAGIEPFVLCEGSERDAGLEAANVHAGQDLGPGRYGQGRQSGQVGTEK